MSLVSTLMQSLRPEYDQALDKNENRASRYGVYDLFRRQTTAPGSILSPGVRAAIKKSFGNTVQVPVVLNQAPTIGNVRTCAVRTGESTTALVNLTFATIAFGFSMYPAQYFNNQLDYQTDFNTKLRAYINALNAHLDTIAVAKLNTDRNIFYPAEITASYPVVANALQVSKAGTEDFYNTAQAILEQMDFYDRIDVAASTLHRPVVRRLQNQGGGNDVNDSFQFGGFNFAYTNRISNGAGIASTAFLVPAGSVAFENRNDPDAILGHTANGGGKIWEEVDVPGVGLRMGSYYTDDCTDASALHAGTTGLTRTKVESFEWSTDICLVTAYNSAPATRFSPIIKAEFSAT